MRWLYQPHATVHHTVNAEQATLGYLVRRSFEEGAGKAQLAAAVGPEEGLSPSVATSSSSSRAASCAASGTGFAAIAPVLCAQGQS